MTTNKLLFITEKSDNSMDVRARAATLLFSLSVNLNLRGGGFASRNLRRYASSRKHVR